MNSILVTDIFGKTEALLALAKAIKAETIIDPYDGRIMAFENEAHAYQYFTENVGLDVYTDKLFQVITNCSDESSLIGFSVGAAAIWQLSGLGSTVVIQRVQSAICFYGSQIRHLTYLSPHFDVQLILPKSEPHFDVLALTQRLVHKERVTIEQVEYLHGFMNVHSNNFNQAGYDEYVAKLQHSHDRVLN